MIFEPDLRVPVPTQDLLSFIFDDPQYDQDDPVSMRPESLSLSTTQSNYG